MMALIMLLAVWLTNGLLVFTVAYVRTQVYHIAQKPHPQPLNLLLVPVFLLLFVTLATLIVQMLKTATRIGRKKRGRQAALEARQKENVVE